MSEGDPSGAARAVRTLFEGGAAGGLTDGELLERFANRDGAAAEAAFTALLERHGPMVWGVCRRLLADRHAAADAFQATFLVLARRAGEVRVDGSLGRWLYGVGRRVAARARANALRRAGRETGRVETVAAPDAGPDPDADERLAAIDEEIGRLPERYRAAVVLCDLEGLPHGEAARRLGCPVGTVESRLSRGRHRLRDRLTRRGLAPAAAALWAESAREASAALPAALVAQTARLVTGPLSAAAPSTAAVALADGVTRMTWFAGLLKPTAAAAAALALATAGVGALARQRPAPPGPGAHAAAAPLPPAVAVAGVGADAPPAPARDVPANRALVKEQLALIDKAVAGLERQAQGGDLRFTDPSFALWERRRLETLRAAGAGKTEMVAALEKYVDRMKTLETVVEKSYQLGRATILDLYDVQFRRTEAEIWLNQEKAR